METESLKEYKGRIAELSQEDKIKRDLYLKDLAQGTILGPNVGYPSIDKPWLKHFDSSIIKSDIPRMNIYEYLFRQNVHNLNGVAIQYMFVKITYKELFKNIEKVADTLYSMGVRENDTIMSILPNVPENIYLIYAAAKIGAKIDLLDPFVNKELLAKYCDRTEPKIIFSLDVLAQNAIANLGKSTYDKVVVLSPVQSIPILNKVAKTSKDIEFNDHVLSWTTFLSKQTDKSKWVKYQRDLPLAILHTGGTTGIPKSALLSHDNMNSLAYQFINSPLEMVNGEKVLNLMPPFASYGLGNGVHVHLCAGMNLILIPTYEPNKIESQIKKFKPNRIACAPAHYEYIKNSKILDKMNLSFLHHPIQGGDNLNIKTEEAVNELFLKNGCQDKVAKGYGLTESCSGVCVCVNNEVNKPQSVGIPMVKNVISAFDYDLDEENNRVITTENELPSGTYGEIAILSPNNMLGYYKMPEETKATLVKHADGNVWLHTGDLGKVDQDGNIFISGRLRRMIISFGGLKASPFEAENELIKHPEVKNVIVVGAKDPDHDQGSIPVAYVLVDEKSLANTEKIRKELEHICEEKVTYYSAPQDYVFVSEYPRTPIGKIDFKAMAKNYEENQMGRKLTKHSQLDY